MRDESPASRWSWPCSAAWPPARVTATTPRPARSPRRRRRRSTRSRRPRRRRQPTSISSPWRCSAPATSACRTPGRSATSILPCSTRSRRSRRTRSRAWLTCPTGAVRGSAAWLQRTFSAPEDPRQDGLLSVDIIVELEDEAAATAGRAALAGCAPVGPDTGVQATELQITPTDASGAEIGPAVVATEVVMTSAPSADVPYPSATTAVSAHRGGRTVTLVLGGLDLGVPFSDSARDLVGRLLGRFN